MGVEEGPPPALQPEPVAGIFRDAVRSLPDLGGVRLESSCPPGAKVLANRALLAADYLATLPTLNQTGKMLHALFSHYRSGSMSSGLRMHDLCAIAWLARPELFTLQPCFVAVETQGTWTAGTTVVDIEGRLGQPANAQVALDIDVEGFQRWAAEVIALAP